MTALGADAPNVVGLVYIAAFGLDEGESHRRAARAGPADAGARALVHRPRRASRWLPEDDFVNHFAADVDPIKAKVMYAVQQPLAGSRLRGRDGRAGLEVAAVLVPGRRRTTRRSRPTPSGSSPQRMGATTVEVPPATSRWSPTPTRSRS